MNDGISRRLFLKYSFLPLLGGISAAVTKSSFAAVSELTGQGLNGPLSYHTFAALLGQPFRMIVTTPERKYAVWIRLEDIATVSLTPGNDQFFLVFKVLNKSIRPNGTYEIRHATAGRTKLYLQSLGDSVPGNYCRAEFNLLT